jgi:hypothetical protein
MNPTANERVSAFSGLKYFRALMEGSVARSSMLELFDINIEAAEPGLVVLTAIPTAEHYNPLGFVHGGYAAVLLDTCMAAAIVTSLEPGLSPVTDTDHHSDGTHGRAGRSRQGSGVPSLRRFQLCHRHRTIRRWWPRSSLISGRRGVDQPASRFARGRVRRSDW